MEGSKSKKKEYQIVPEQLKKRLAGAYFFEQKSRTQLSDEYGISYHTVCRTVIEEEKYMMQRQREQKAARRAVQERIQKQDIKKQEKIRQDQELLDIKRNIEDVQWIKEDMRRMRDKSTGLFCAFDRDGSQHFSPFEKTICQRDLALLGFSQEYLLKQYRQSLLTEEHVQFWFQDHSGRNRFQPAKIKITPTVFQLIRQGTDEKLIKKQYKRPNQDQYATEVSYKYEDILSFEIQTEWIKPKKQKLQLWGIPITYFIYDFTTFENHSIQYSFTEKMSTNSKTVKEKYFCQQGILLLEKGYVAIIDYKMVSHILNFQAFFSYTLTGMVALVKNGDIVGFRSVNEILEGKFDPIMKKKLKFVVPYDMKTQISYIQQTK